MIVVDMEAGLEHLSRGTGRHATRVLVVMEPYFRSMETARRAAELARELNVPDVVAVANKVRDAADRSALADFCAAHALPLVGELPWDPSLLDAERAGSTPLDYAPTSPAVRGITQLAEQLLRPTAPPSATPPP